MILKKYVKAMSLGLLLIAGALSVNAAQAAQKIGYISTAYVISKLPQREGLMNKVKAELKDDQAELNRILDEMKQKSEKIKRDGDLLGKDGVQKLQIEIRSLKAEGEIKNSDYKKKVQALEYKAQKQMIDLVQKAAAKVAEKEGYDMVIDSQFLQFAKPELNLTEKVLTELK